LEVDFLIQLEQVTKKKEAQFQECLFFSGALDGMVCGLRTHRPVWGCFLFLFIAFSLVFFFSMFFFIQGLEFNFDLLLMQLQLFLSEI